LRPAAIHAHTDDFSDEVRAALAHDGVAAIALDGMTAAAVPSLEKAVAARARRGPEARQIEIFTSGTTGPPKQFAIAHETIARHHIMASGLTDLDDDAALNAPPHLLYFPVGNISGLYSTLPAILRGHRAILLDRFTIEAWRRYVVEHRPVRSGIPPSYFRALLDANIPQADLSSIQAMGAGAASLDPEIQRAFEDRYGIPILISYGATEFAGPVAMMSLEDHAKFGRAKLGSVGRAFGGAKLRIVDPASGAPLAPNTEGLIEVVSPRIGPDWIRTADIGVIDEDGFLFHRGRADGAIMRGGFKLLPETIETALKLHPDVADAVVVALPDERLGQIPAAAIRLKSARRPPDGALEAHARQNLMATHIPVKWLIVEDYPRTVSAKIDRQAVRALFLSGTA
jgi:acyl-coenzyme A synthetase/AMP-(fatty) acid ligase